ncbi:MAG: uroporphyrinogen decarboxylase [Arenicellales bacterium]|nr:uroporphyrinogen decarboxylase [Arenicellales bacterium]
MKDRLLRALKRQPVDRTPVWVMRQAGRYLPEYRAVREQAGSFLNLCQNPELACEVTLQPLRRFGLDGAILFSDILTIPDAMGLGLTVNEGEGPRFARPIRRVSQIDGLTVPDAETDIGYVLEAVRLIRQQLAGTVPLIGFAGSPWTLATYMIEGESSRDFRHSKGLLYTEPGRMHQLLEVLTEAVSGYLHAQIVAGVQAVMIFDTWGGTLAHADYQEFSLAYLSRIVAALQAALGADAVPIILFTKGGGQWLSEIADSGCDAIGIDWTQSLFRARQLVSDRVALQGNLDPAVLRAPPDTIRREVKRVLADYGPGPGHIFNLGHGITPDIDPDHMAVMVDAVREFGQSSV